jgi:hypothetical protein
MRMLTPDSATAEREKVEEVDAALVGLAKEIQRFTRHRSVAGQLANIPPVQDVVEETVQIRSNAPGRTTARVVSRLTAPFDSVAADMGYVSSVVGRFWSDLVFKEDYFRPTAGWGNTTTNPNDATEFRMTDRIPLVGDLVTRCLQYRIDTVVAELERIYGRILAASRTPTRGRPPSRDGVEEAWRRLRVAVTACRRAIRIEPAARIRDSCICLAQIYFAYREPADVAWLGLAADTLALGNHHLRHHAQSLRNHVFFERVHSALGDLDLLYRGLPPEVSALEEAVAGGGLVLDEGPSVFWEGTIIPAEWSRNGRPWDLLVRLVEAGPAGEVEPVSMFPRSASGTALPNLVNRLRNLLPASLRCRIRPVGGGSYRLDLSDPLPISFYEA